MQAAVRIFLMASVLALGACTSIQAPDPKLSSSTVQSEKIPDTIYFLGLAGETFSTGMYEMQKVTGGKVYSWGERRALEKRIIAAHKAGKLKGYRFKIVGHSLGGNSANWMANNLIAAGITVDYVATLDATDPQPVDKRIGRADNFMSRDFRAKHVPGAVLIDRSDLSHIELDNDPKVKSMVTEQVR